MKSLLNIALKLHEGFKGEPDNITAQIIIRALTYEQAILYAGSSLAHQYSKSEWEAAMLDTDEKIVDKIDEVFNTVHATTTTKWELVALFWLLGNKIVLGNLISVFNDDAMFAYVIKNWEESGRVKSYKLTWIMGGCAHTISVKAYSEDDARRKFCNMTGRDMLDVAVEEMKNEET